MKSSTFELGLTKKKKKKIVGRRFHCSQCFSKRRFTYVAMQQLCKLEKKNVFTKEKSSTPTGTVWHTNMAVVTSCENNPISNRCF